MTIRKGEEWGRDVARPAGLRVAADDGELAAMLLDGSSRPTAVAAGDMHRTLGGRDLGGRGVLHELPIDVIVVSLDDERTFRAVSHVVARRPWSRGGWWRGPVLVVMNAEFLGEWDLAPRGHPNDGRVEVQLVDASMGLRNRWQARGRLPHGAHVPHPDISTRSVRSARWDFDAPVEVRTDGRVVGASTSIAVEVAPDAATVYA